MGSAQDTDRLAGVGMSRPAALQVESWGGVAHNWLTTPLDGLLLTPAFALTVFFLAVYWWRRVWVEARIGFGPRVAWWAVPGLVALLLARTLEVPALFGMGAAALLLAEFWPGSYRRVREARGSTAKVGWALVLGVLGAAFFGMSKLEPSWAAAGAGLLVAAGGQFCFVLGVAVRARSMGGPFGAARQTAVSRTYETRNPAFAVRWSTVKTPVFPELELSLGDEGARVRNVSSHPLTLAAWAPKGVNAVLLPRDAHGRLLEVLEPGSEALLPLGPADEGVRIWYRAADGNEAHVYRADWDPAVLTKGAERVLN